VAGSHFGLAVCATLDEIASLEGRATWASHQPDASGRYRPEAHSDRFIRPRTRTGPWTDSIFSPPANRFRTMTNMIVLQDVNVAAVVGESKPHSSRRRTCETCGTALSRYNESEKYCFIHQPLDFRLRNRW
jgi:hypothetical protein